MKESIARLTELLKGSSGATRVVIVAASALILAVAGFFMYGAQNPHFMLLYGSLSDAASAKTDVAIPAGTV